MSDLEELERARGNNEFVGRRLVLWSVCKIAGQGQPVLKCVHFL